MLHVEQGEMLKKRSEKKNKTARMLDPDGLAKKTAY